MENIANNLIFLLANITKIANTIGREPTSIKLLAVSKGQSLEKIKTAIFAGQFAFGENYLQEALPKIDALKNNPEFANFNLEWHFIGHIQHNKTRSIAENFQWVHSVDNIKTAQRLNSQRPDYLPPLNICIAINQSGIKTRSGISLAALPELIFAIQSMPHLRLRGLMTMITDDYPQVGQAFCGLQAQGVAIDTLSMGMSQDYAIAIANGATLVRIGTAIFGER